MAASAIINWIGSPEHAKTGDELVIRCQAQNTGDTSCYLRIILYDADTNEVLYDYGKHGLVSPGSTLNPSPGFPIPKTVTMPDHDWNLIAKVWVDDREDPDDELTKTIINGAPPPTISNISWSPAGDFHKLPSGASLPGSTEDLYLIGTDPSAFADPGFSDGEALLRIGTDGAMFAVAEGDHFRFDDMEWWILNIVCGPECSFITLADENAEAAKEPKLGDEIQFSCNVDWHGEEPDEVRWYYARTPNRCFDEGDVSWTLLANEQYPLHIFEDDTDTDIVFIKAWARNAAGEIGELGDTCEPVFNLWEYHPSWWDSLLESIRNVDENIAKPIMDLFVIEGLEGWTEPPFTCMICEQVFDGSGSELEYAEHLMSHIKAFEKGWFGFNTFKIECLSNGCVICNWTTLKHYLENHTVSKLWWKLTETERRSIAEMAIKNTLFYKITSVRKGQPDCKGGEGEWKQGVCYQNAIIRYMKFATHVTGADACYWKNASQEEVCYIPDNRYNLPCNIVICTSADFGHALCAIQVVDAVDSLDNWVIFQYAKFDIKPGHQQLPYKTCVKMYQPTDFRCDGIDAYNIIAEFDI